MTDCENEYANEAYVQYDDGATFVRRCEKCGRFVKPDDVIYVNGDGLKDVPNATCKKCGRTKMIFLGFI